MSEHDDIVTDDLRAGDRGTRQVSDPAKEDPVTYWGQEMHAAPPRSPRFYWAELNYRAALRWQERHDAA